MSTLSFGSLWSNLINFLSLFKMHACKARRSWDGEYDDMTGRVNVRLRSARSHWVPEVDVIGKDKKKLWRK